MTQMLSDSDWENLLKRIKSGKCTPFLGAGASADRIQSASRIAEEWATRYGYPLTDRHNLARVAQYRAVVSDNILPKEDVAGICNGASYPDYSDENELYTVLAGLPLSVFVTTNYDDFMFKALQQRPTKDKSPRKELCRWNEYINEVYSSVFDTEPGYRPDISNPLVFHLHGSADVPASMVLTEDDYLDFQVWLAKEWSNQNVLPGPVTQAIAGTSLLFIGYSWNDWNFRVLFRSLVNSVAASVRMTSVAVQLAPESTTEDPEAQGRAEEFLERYFNSIQKIPVRMYWGSAADFAVELKTRWEDFDR